MPGGGEPPSFKERAPTLGAPEVAAVQPVSRLARCFACSAFMVSSFSWPPTRSSNCRPPSGASSTRSHSATGIQRVRPSSCATHSSSGGSLAVSVIEDVPLMPGPLVRAALPPGLIVGRTAIGPNTRNKNLFALRRSIQAAISARAERETASHDTALL